MPQFDHEKLDVYQVSLEFVAYAFKLVADLDSRHKCPRDQLIRASQSVALNIAEGNGKRSRADRNRYFEIARGSALECAGVLDILRVTGALTAEKLCPGRALLLRIVSMLYRMTERRNGGVAQGETEYNLREDAASGDSDDENENDDEDENDDDDEKTDMA